jgi:hypothetical protein
MKIFPILFILLNAGSIYAQIADTDIQSLLAAENYFSGLSADKGVKKAFLKVSDDETIVFRPSPVAARKFYKDAKEDSTFLSWYPSYARISISGDWGFTSGPYIAKASKESEKKIHGQYLSVWKRNSKGVWKLAIDAGIRHPEPKAEPKLDFASNTGNFFRQHSTLRQQQRKDIVVSTEKLFSLTLKAIAADAYNEFADDDIHILFPGVYPIVGKKNAIAFFNSQKMRFLSETIAADRAFGGEYAYTYGTASLTRSAKKEEFNYIRIWQRSEENTWNVLFELFSPTATNVKKDSE